MSPKIICKVFLLFFLSGLPTLFTVNVSAQNSSGKKVSGKVTDENGNAMPGVSITVSGSSAGTSTDSSGNFSITAPSKSSTLIFSSVNYLNKEEKNYPSHCVNRPFYTFLCHCIFELPIMINN